jgi:hypothetical protein
MNDLTEQLAVRFRLSLTDTREILEEVFAHIHRRLFEGKNGDGPRINGDYIGESLRWDIGSDAYFHFIGMLVCITKYYGVEEPGEWVEYASRTFSAEEAERLNAQMSNWKSQDR